ncbi:lipase member H [Teleopsis dalmanni]|uniref:lipase member H n=1 Tax=Teleopsis dalmanni TaxID=139649 RepID=UPI0018CD30F3|nr:lipase member H [Teleopsis dalmanni]
MRLYSLFLLSTIFFVALASAKFAYERGSCDISIFSVVQDMLKSEVRALIDPTLRYGTNKRIRYDLYTPYNPYERQILRTGDVAGLKRSFFNPKWPVRFSIHGWAGKGMSCSNAAIKDAYLARGNFNVIIVDWSAHANDINYARISKQLSSIAANFVKFVNFLHRETGVAYENIYLIGHSAGSHFSGLAGKLIKPNRFGAIFALDPAGLTQLSLSEKYRLASTDALYVESIHSDITLLGNPNTELSQASFYPNWGLGQPQCPNATSAEFDFSCDHFAALYYFAESVRNSKMFGAVKCNAFKNNNYSNIYSDSDISSSSTSNSDSNNINNNIDGKYNCSCEHGAAVDVCNAVTFMGGEPAVPKSGVYYLSTQTRSPYGFGRLVHMRPAINPNFLKSSFLSQRVIDKIYFVS